MLLHDPLLYWGRATPDNTFASDADRSLTWGDGLALCTKVAAALVAGSVRPGDRVAIITNNCVEFLVALYGASLAGVVPVPVNPRLAPAEWRHIVTDADATLVLATADLLAGTSLPAELPCPTVILRGDAPAGCIPFDTWLDVPGTELPRVSESDDVYQLYTSGTTGRPKGAVFTHHAINGILQRWQMHGMRLAPGDRLYMAMPVCLAAGMVTALDGLYSGAEVVLAPAFSPDEAVRALDEDRIAATAMAPTMIQRCLEVPGAGSRNFASLKWILYGAAPIPRAVLEQAMTVLGCDFYQGFGQTEAAAITLLTAADHRAAAAGNERLLASVGRPQCGVDVGILDLDDQPVAPGELGEICVHAEFVMKEYWRAPELTAQTQRGGWHHTGDIGYLDDSGVLFVVDRIKDVIISGGLNVYPREVERVIEDFPEVVQVAVIGVLSATWGEEVTAVVRLAEPGSLSEEEVTRRCRQELGSFKVPKRIVFVDDFAVNANGKVLKAELRRRYADIAQAHHVG